MAKIRRGNVVLRVDEALVDYYVNMGYDLIDEESGSVIRAAIPKDVGVLQKFYIEHMLRIEQLEDKVAELSTEIEALKKSTKKPARKKDEE